MLCVGLTPAVQRTLAFGALKPGTVNRALEARETVGGKGANAAKVVVALGGEAIYLGFLGGLTGAWIRRRLKKLGVVCEGVATRVPSRYCHTLIDRLSGAVTELVEEAPLPAPREWAALRHRFRERAASGFLILAGKLPPGAPEDAYALLLREQPGCAARAVIDTHGPALPPVLAERPLLVKMNRAEWAATFPIPAGDDRALVREMAACCRRGGCATLVTEGARGAWLHDGSVCRRFQPPVVKAVNATGSGDAVSAGIAWALGRGAALVDAVARGLACGAANALTPAAGEIDPAKAEALYRGVRIRTVSPEP